MSTALDQRPTSPLDLDLPGGSPWLRFDDSFADSQNDSWFAEKLFYHEF
jgi:hypothetical protein